nr:InlB B-repeat-containing protein [Cellulomonas denverensis]
MEYVKFDQATNGGSWSGQTPTFPQGDSYFTGTDAATGWYEVANPGTTVTFPPDPTPPALHSFTGWFTEPTGGTQVTDATAAGQTLYAQFAPLTYTVTFDSAGGSAVDPVTGITPGDPVTEPADPTYPGHTFNGWLLDGAPYDFSSPVTQDFTLVASWTPVPPVDPEPEPDPEPTPDPTPDPTVPPTPVTPDPPSTTVIKPGLAVTGPAAVAGIALGAVLLIGAGTAAVAARRRRG